MPRFAVSARELQKLLKRLGIATQAQELKATRVVIELEDGRRLVAENPQVMMLRLGGNTLVNIMAPTFEEEKPVVEEVEKPKFTEEDVKLVAEQAGVSLEEARRALEETGGDIAEAILRLMERRGQRP